MYRQCPYVALKTKASKTIKVSENFVASTVYRYEHVLHYETEERDQNLHAWFSSVSALSEHVLKLMSHFS